MVDFGCVTLVGCFGLQWLLHVLLVLRTNTECGLVGTCT